MLLLHGWCLCLIAVSLILGHGDHFVDGSKPSRRRVDKNKKVKKQSGLRQEERELQRRISDDWMQRIHMVGEEEEDAFSCPCENPDWCRPIPAGEDGLPLRASGEVFGFAAARSTGELWNWTHITTVAWGPHDELMCRAHSFGVRSIWPAPSLNLTKAVEEPNYVREWSQAALRLVQNRFRDGLVFDFEQPLPLYDERGKAYARLIAATRDLFHTVNPPLQVSTCLAWSPDGIDGRNFPSIEIAEASDLVYVMDYDTESQVPQGPCVANANAPVPGTKLGIEKYIALGIPPSKLVLGVPWYGYKYECLEGTKPDARFCPIPLVPFRGVACSDAAGHEVSFSKILTIFHDRTPEEIRVTGGLRRDDYVDAPFFNALLPASDNNNDDEEEETSRGQQQHLRDPSSAAAAPSRTSVYQFWFDDDQSLRHKFAYARSVGLGGVGPYTFEALDPSVQPHESAMIWSTLDEFQQETPPSRPPPRQQEVKS